MATPPVRRKRKKERVLPKTTILFFVGIGLVIFEAANPPADLGILFAGLAMIGFPVSEIGDFLKNARWGSDETDDEEPSL